MPANMKIQITLMFCFITFFSFGQTVEKFDGPSWNPPYTLTLDGWGIERFLIPVDFAPKIPYKGVEDIRFTLGWGDKNSEEYWSYAFLWYLDGKPAIDAVALKRNLDLYYDGLISRNIIKRNISAKIIFKTNTKLKQIATYPGDEKTFQGTVTMLDYMAKAPMVLNCKVHLKKCKGLDKTILFYQLSPKTYSDAVWKKLTKLWADFNCGK
jgi:hypothetical protein